MPAQHHNIARGYLQKAQEYLASAEDNLSAVRITPAVGDAIHAGISAKDAIVSELTGSTKKSRDHATAAKELSIALAKRDTAASLEKALRDLLAAKADVEYSAQLMTEIKARPLIRKARALVEAAFKIVEHDK